MRTARGISVAGMLAVSACVGAPVPVTRAPLSVSNNGKPFAMWDGAAARKVADATCAARGQRLRPSIYDRFDRASGQWVYPEGCL